VPERESLYRILQVDPGANQLVIQAAFRVLARIFHPDVEGDDEQMKRLNHAWSILGDPLRRAEYDRQLAGRHQGPAIGTASPSAAAPHPSPGAAAAHAAPARHTTPAYAAPAPDAAGASAAHASSGATDRHAPPRPDDHAGPPRGEPFGPLLTFGRYEGWTLGQVARVDRTFLEWLRNVPAGRGLKDEIDAVLSVRRGPGAVDERRHYETNKAKVHTWAPGAPTKVR
jgi:curved DNA-binding protein CbpA